MSTPQKQTLRNQMYFVNVRDLENFLLPSDSDLGNFMGNFFGALMEVTTAGDIHEDWLQLKSLLELLTNCKHS